MHDGRRRWSIAFLPFLPSFLHRSISPSLVDYCRSLVRCKAVCPETSRRPTEKLLRRSWFFLSLFKGTDGLEEEEEDDEEEEVKRKEEAEEEDRWEERARGQLRQGI